MCLPHHVLQVCPVSHWPELVVLILVVSSEKKAVSSTRGMQTTVTTSPLMKVQWNLHLVGNFTANEASNSLQEKPSVWTKLYISDF